MPVMNMVQALNTALREEMRRDKSVVVLGEDVGRRGGVFLVTEGLIDEFGEERVIDTPLTEMGIVAFAIGMAMYGLRPVAEIQFIDFIYEAFDQIVNNAAWYRFRSGGMYNVPLVIRGPCCGGIRGGMHHSQSNESYFIHTPGLYVVMPSTPYDAKGLLKSSIRSDDAVIFLEPKSIYRTIREEVPDDDYTIPLGQARLVQEGSDVTLVTWGAMVHLAKEAAELLREKRGWSIEIIDLRTLQPWDKDMVVKSLEKTGRLVIVHEARKILGPGAEIAAYISENYIDLLRGPVKRVASYDTPYPLAHEKLYLPNLAKIYRAVTEVMQW
ncbi:pyruvate dehydrogenase E1 component, beta subunit [Aeropyrum pernix]|uniref:2-oxoacid oxidoreductase (ferredoxin) n=2 Tax=Aeropyrum pernix TaxID=56636 RepID=A0A401HA72_AERPX|nr:pyruvate dehydrogenase E1 component, beta subunit [Aeropyrum pernix]